MCRACGPFCTCCLPRHAAGVRLIQTLGVTLNHRIIWLVLAAALALVAAVATPYYLQFGGTLSTQRDAWGQFGDYFAGLLNPVFSMLAFLGLVLSIVVQRNEAKEANARLSEQIEINKKELEQAQSQRFGSELLAVVQDIDQRLATILKTVVSSPGTHPDLTISLMISEAIRVREGASSPAHDEFIRIARDRGSVVEATVREMTELVLEMKMILTQFSAFHGTSRAPLIVYYANKVYGLLTLLEDVGTIPTNTRAFFASIGDSHH
jgi:uncharacterized membrane protein